MNLNHTIHREWRTTVDGLCREETLRLMAIRRHLIGRCYNPRNGRFQFYGARGVTVCDEWRQSTRAFLEWCVAAGSAPGLEIDRKDSDGPYSPENCRWVTHQQNSMNRRNRRNSLSEFKGVRKNLNRGRPWHAMIFVNGKAKHIGYFDTEEEAARAYDRAAIEHFGEFARLNFPAEPTA